MKFGVRECANMVFKAKQPVKIGPYTFKKGQPVLYIDSARTSTIEESATSVYAQGGRGYTRLIAWEGEKNLTFTVEEALLSPISMAMVSGAKLFKGASDSDELVHVHTTAMASIDEDGALDLSDALAATENICATAPIFIVETENGDLTGNVISGGTVSGQTITGLTDGAGKTVFVDFYVTKKAAKVSELQIDAENFAGYYYVEADTLVRRQVDGKDLPANITFPNVKVQTALTFAMSSSGDPSTFTFTMDAFPGYTMFNHTRKVLTAIQIVEDVAEEAEDDVKTVFPHPADFKTNETTSDSYLEESGDIQGSNFQ